MSETVTKNCTFCGRVFQSPRYTGSALSYDPNTCSLTCTNKARREAANKRAKDASDQPASSQ